MIVTPALIRYVQPDDLGEATLLRDLPWSLEAVWFSPYIMEQPGSNGFVETVPVATETAVERRLVLGRFAQAEDARPAFLAVIDTAETWLSGGDQRQWIRLSSVDRFEIILTVLGVPE